MSRSRILFFLSSFLVNKRMYIRVEECASTLEKFQKIFRARLSKKRRATYQAIIDKTIEGSGGNGMRRTGSHG